MLADTAYLPLIIGRTIPIFPGQSCFQFLAILSRGPFPISPQKTTSSNFRGKVAAWGPDLRKKKGGGVLHLKNKNQIKRKQKGKQLYNISGKRLFRENMTFKYVVNGFEKAPLS